LRKAAAGFRLPGGTPEPPGASGAFPRPAGEPRPGAKPNAATSGNVRQISALGGT